MTLSFATLLNVMLFSIMLGMGTTLDFQTFRQTLQSPKPFLVGMISQFGLMPLLGFLIALALGLSPEMSLGLLLIACTPGGSTSNLYTYYSKGDLALSISMTVASTLVATLMMPLLLKVYAVGLGIEGSIMIPYQKIILMLMMMLIPVILGMVLRKINLNWAKFIEKITAYIGILAIIILFILSIKKELLETPYQVFVASALIAFAGMALGYWISRFLKLSIPQSKTVSLETGIQNAVLTVGIIALSFEGDLQVQLLVVPSLYIFFIPIFSALAAFVVFRYWVGSHTK